MDPAYERFMETVQRIGGLSRPDAERAARATLEVLAERLSKGQARDLAAELPPQLSPSLFTDGGPEPFHVDELLRRVSAREGVDLDTARRHARAVFAGLGRIVRDEEIDDLAAELPSDFAPLVAEAQRRFVEVLPAEEFLRRVADRAGLRREEARAASEAVLETLAERISRGEVDDLIGELPVELHDPLRRGDELSNGAARPMSLEQFVGRVAEREGVTPAQAQAHARAVFATLREAVSQKEFLDVTAQLPRDYAALEARP
jgi:uncharacterized protein (DUF2267 family)